MKIWPKRLKCSIIVVLFFAIGELIAKFYLGLGDPPLSVADDEIDYLFKPNQECARFGNRIVYNNYSMRNEFDLQKTYGGRRILVVGDSIVNGGALTDQENVCTSVLGRLIPRWQVCNVSAGSWGPGNYLAYLKRYPELVRACDVLVIQVSSHDLWEDDASVGKGRIVGMDRSFPNRKPWCALWDGFSRYAWPRLCRKFKIRSFSKGEEGVNDVIGKVAKEHMEKDALDKAAKYNLRCCEEIFELPFSKKYLLIHRSRKEAKDGEATVGERAWIGLAKKHGVGIVYDGAGAETCYRDPIHLNDEGHRRLARALFEALKTDHMVD